MGSPKSAAAIAMIVLALSACSGSGGGATGVTPGPASSEGTPATSAPTPASSDAAAPSAAPVGAAVDLCGLLTAADLKAATGADYGEGKLDDYGQCFWLVGDAGVNTGDGQVVAAIQAAPLDTIKSTFPGGVDVTVSGHAGYWHPAPSLQSMWVDIGGRTLVISIDPVPPDGQAIAQALAEIAVARL